MMGQVHHRPGHEGPSHNEEGVLMPDRVELTRRIVLTRSARVKSTTRRDKPLTPAIAAAGRSSISG